MFRRRYLARAVLCAGLLLALGAANAALDSDSGQRTFGEVVVEPAIDDSTGETIFLLSLGKIAVPAHANDEATAPLYLPLYPLSSKISTFDLNCQPTNCAHVNVLRFTSAGMTRYPLRVKPASISTAVRNVLWSKGTIT